MDMAKTQELLTQILSQRIKSSAPRAQYWLSGASEVIVFGSMSVGLNRPDSDIDVLCIGGDEGKVKTNELDLIAVSVEATRSRAWLQSELASHVAEYGTWIKGSPTSWRSEVGIGPTVAMEKRRRVSAFMTAIPKSWLKLEERFRVKFSTKLRRETQRLILLERSVPIPPTRILDCSWFTISKSPTEVHERLRALAPNSFSAFTDDLLARLDPHTGTGSPPA